MIGVVARAGERGIVEEFFELFKTPWEFYEPGRVYDVVIAAAGEVPAADARLIVLYGSDVKSSDAAQGVGTGTRRRGVTLSVGGSPLPIYGDLLTFAPEASGSSFLESSAGVAGVAVYRGGTTIRRLGYDVFGEVRFLLSEGQPVEYAHVPTLDIHIAMLRSWILDAGVSLIEILPAPAHHSFLACLTHDIDFSGIRSHVCDHTMWGFLYRSTFGAVRNVLRRRISFQRLVQTWVAAASLPFVYLRWVKDFWDPFEWYLQVEHGLPATYFVIPVRGRAGERVPGRNASRRAAAYDVSDLADRVTALTNAGCEVGVHGLDAWHSAERGLEERARVTAVTGTPAAGIRMHWLLRDETTPAVLDTAGYAYDAGLGYNETIGYRNGTTQVFRPDGVRHLLELPLQIQDGALFFPQRLDLSESEARTRTGALVDHARRFGGALTVLWHDRSHGPERFWGDFYIDLVSTLRTLDAWFGTAAQVVDWFARRREVRFERVAAGDGAGVRLCHRGPEIRPPLSVRVHRPSACGDESPVDMPWNGQADLTFDMIERGSCEPILACASQCSVQ